MRRGEPSDIEAAVEVWREAESARGDYSPSRDLEERARNYIAKPDAFLFVAEESESPGEVVGMAVGMQGLDVDGDGAEIPGLCHVAAVFVAPERWGEGVGSRLVHAALDEARARGYARVQLWTHRDNPRAQRLYEGKGFMRSGGTRIDDGGETIIHYEREL